MGSYVIGIDAGGTMTKAALFDLAGHEIACARRRNVMLFPNAGWTERDPDAMWNAAATAIKEVIEAANINPGDILGVAVSGYGSGLYLVDRDGNPVRNGIISTDDRAQDILADWTDRGLVPSVQGMIHQHTWWAQSLVLMAWVQKHEPEVFAKTHRVAFCKDFLRGRLCGDQSTDFTDAGSAGLLNCAKHEYATDALELLDMQGWVEKLPELGVSDAVVGGVSDAAAELTGLLPGTPVVRGAVDMAASALASGVVSSDQMSIVAGTFSIASTLHKNRPKTDTLPILQFPYPLGGWLAVEASPTSASNLEWVVKQLLAHGGQLDDMDALYDRVNAAVSTQLDRPIKAMFYPYLFGSPEGTPAGLVGVDATTTFDEIMAAVFQGIVFAHKRDIDQALSGSDAVRPNVLRLTGGATRSEPWTGMFADVLDLPVEVPRGSEFGALGVAICAAAATGAYDNLGAAVTGMTAQDRRHDVHQDRGRMHREKYDHYRSFATAMAAAWGA